MREIKFRGYSERQRVWVYGSLMRGCGVDRIVFPVRDGRCTCEVVSHSVSQYTGIKDVNGIEVYEGDVLHMREFDNRFLHIFGKDADTLDFTLDECKGRRRDAYVTCIRFADGEFVFSDGRGCDTSLSVLWGDMRRSSPLFEFEVIGNVYEHPEYLTKGVKC